MNFRFPIGAHLLNRLSSCLSMNRYKFYQSSILILTFLCYFSFHASRRPLSVVKSILNQNCSKLNTPDDHLQANSSYELQTNDSDGSFDHWCDWKPFDGADSKSLLSLLDLAFLITYAIFMFVSGYLAERCNLRYFLGFGMILTGLFNYLFGLAHSYEIHSLYYFIAIQICSGILNTTGWPTVVALVGNWFGKSKRGLIFGIWNSHTSLGNIAGAAIAGYFVESNWGYSFFVPGFIMIGVGVIMLIFLVPRKQKFAE